MRSPRKLGATAHRLFALAVCVAAIAAAGCDLSDARLAWSVRRGQVGEFAIRGEEVFTIGMNRAVELLAQKSGRGAGGRAVQPLRTLGEHPDGGTVAVYPGRYGPYVKWEKVNATLPKELAPEDVTLEQALELIAAKKPVAKEPRATAKTAKAKAKAQAAAPKRRAAGE